MSYTRTSQLSEHLRVAVDSLDRVVLVENFERKPGINADIQNSSEATRMVANANFEVLGTNASSDDVTLADGGGIKAETDGASADQVIILPHLDTNQTSWSTTKWNTNDEVGWACVTTTGSSVADTTIWAGLKLTNTSVVATDNDQAFFRYAAGTNSGAWQCIYSVGGTDYTLNTDVTVLASTTFKLEIRVDGDRKPHFYIDGDEVKIGANALTADTDLIPYWGVQADTAAAKHAYLRKVVASKAYAD